MKQAIGYIRVSTEKQANEGVSLEAQEAKIVTWCKANGYELVRVYVDAGISGKRMDTRKELLAALASLKKGMALVSYSACRGWRGQPRMPWPSVKRIAKKKADMVSLTEQIDTTTAAGKMMFQMLSVLAEFERNLVAERTTRPPCNTRSATGQKYTNQTPYGFEAIEGRLVEVELEAKVVAEIQAARSSGTTLQAIADNLNGRGIPTKTGKTWAPATIHLLLKRSSLVSAH
jgi:site-specific DNA recombinase